jgi:hypothetical protein
LGRLSRCSIAGVLPLAALLVAASGSAAPGDPPCAPDKTLVPTFEGNENGERAPLVATHELQLVADWPAGEVRNPSLLVPQGVRVLGRAPRKLRLIVPDGATLDVTASWEQATDPSDPDADASDPATRCVATQTTQLPVTAPRPSRAFYDLVKSYEPEAWSTFAVVPDPQAGDLSPLEVSIRVTGAARFPSASTKARRMPVAMRPSERLRYRKHIPHDSLATTPVLCRFYYLTCSQVYTSVAALQERGHGRIRKRDLRGGDLLSRVQPYRKVAPFGVRIFPHVASAPGHEPPAVGYDVQVRQSGRLVGRIRRAARCGAKRNRFNVRVYRCHVVRRENG